MKTLLLNFLSGLYLPCCKYNFPNQLGGFDGYLHRRPLNILCKYPLGNTWHLFVVCHFYLKFPCFSLVSYIFILLIKKWTALKQTNSYSFLFSLVSPHDAFQTLSSSTYSQAVRTSHLYSAGPDTIFQPPWGPICGLRRGRARGRSGKLPQNVIKEISCKWKTLCLNYYWEIMLKLWIPWNFTFWGKYHSGLR